MSRAGGTWDLYSLLDSALTLKLLWETVYEKKKKKEEEEEEEEGESEWGGRGGGRKGEVSTSSGEPSLTAD